MRARRKHCKHTPAHRPKCTERVHHYTIQQKVKNDHRSKFSNLSSWRDAWKKSGLQRDSNPWPPRIPVPCSTNWAIKPHVRSEVNLLSSCLPVRSEMMWIISDIVHIWTAVVDECEEWLSQYFFQFKNWKEETWRYSLNKNDFIYNLHHYTPHGKIWTQLIDHAPSSNPVEALIFFRLLPSNCLNWNIYCDDHSSLSSTTAV